MINTDELFIQIILCKPLRYFEVNKKGGGYIPLSIEHELKTQMKYFLNIFKPKIFRVEAMRKE